MRVCKGLCNNMRVICIMPLLRPMLLRDYFVGRQYSRAALENRYLLCSFNFD